MLTRIPSAVLLALLSACVSNPPASTPAAPIQVAQATLPAAVEEKIAPLAAAPAEMQTTRPLSSNEQTELQLHIMAGEMAAGRDQPAEAAREFLAALKVVNDAELAQRATALALSAQDDALALQAATRWLELAPNEMDPREVIARVSLAQGRLSDTITQCEAIVSGHAGGVDDGLRHVSLLLTQAASDRGDAALAVMSQLLGKRAELPAAHQALGLVALRFGKLETAEKAAREALRLAPASREHSLLLTGVLIRQNRLDESGSIIAGLLAKEKEPAELRLSYSRLLLDAGQRDAARAQLKLALEANPKLNDARYALGVMALTDRQYDEASGLLVPLLTSSRGQDAAFQLGRSEEGRKQYDKALEYYEMVRNGTQALEAAIRRAYVLALMGKTPQSRGLLQNLREQLPQLASRFTLAEADILLTAGAHREALGVYDGALKQAPDDAELLYGRSLVHEKMKQIALAEKDLRAILKQDQDNSQALNALGYTLTVHTRRYDEAKKMIARALELDPEDPAIMDSYGWVQFKLGKADEALNWLQKAHQRMPDPEVAAHLGEVLWSKGQKDQARAVWDKALKDDPDHPVVTEAVQRLAR